MAQTTVNNYGPTRPNTRLIYPANSDTPQTLFNGGETLVAQALPPYAALTSLGQTWQCSIATGSAFTHVAAWPTTRAEIVFFNGYAAGTGVCMVIEQVWAANVATSIAAASSYTLIAQIVPSSSTALTNDTAQLITSMSGKTGYQGAVTRAVANTSYAVASKWQPLSSSATNPGSVSIGICEVAEVLGGMIVPPQAFLCLNLVVGTATGTASIGCVWDELVLNLG